jgi:hypothetical protein
MPGFALGIAGQRAEYNTVHEQQFGQRAAALTCVDLSFHPTIVIGAEWGLYSARLTTESNTIKGVVSWQVEKKFSKAWKICWPLEKRR